MHLLLNGLYLNIQKDFHYLIHIYKLVLLQFGLTIQRNQYLNIINVPKGFKIFNSGKYVDKTTHYDIVLAPDCEYELIDKLDDYTFVWECISQRFYE